MLTDIDLLTCSCPVTPTWLHLRCSSAGSRVLTELSAYYVCHYTVVRSVLTGRSTGSGGFNVRTMCAIIQRYDQFLQVDRLDRAALMSVLCAPLYSGTISSYR